MSTPAPENKVTVAGFTAAVAGLVLYFLNMIPVVAGMDDVTKAMLGVVVLGVVTFAAGYATTNSQPNSQPDGQHELGRDERGATDAQQAFSVVAVLVLAAIAAAVLLT